MSELPRLLTLQEVAKTLRLSEQTVVRNSRAGKLPSPVRVGGSLRWRESDLVTLLTTG